MNVFTVLCLLATLFLWCRYRALWRQVNQMRRMQRSPLDEGFVDQQRGSEE